MVTTITISQLTTTAVHIGVTTVRGRVLTHTNTDNTDMTDICTDIPEVLVYRRATEEPTAINLLLHLYSTALLSLWPGQQQRRQGTDSHQQAPLTHLVGN